jgi:hypothetical protein
VTTETDNVDGMVALLRANTEPLIERWVSLISVPLRGRLSEAELARECREPFAALVAAVETGSRDSQEPAFSEVRALLEDLSRSRARLGFTVLMTDGLVERPGVSITDDLERLRLTMSVTESPEEICRRPVGPVRTEQGRRHRGAGCARGLRLGTRWLVTFRVFGLGASAPSPLIVRRRAGE